MTRHIKNVFKFIQAFMVGVVLQRVIIPVVLVMLYIFGVGLTSLFARIFSRRQLAPVRPANSNWVLATGFEVTEENKTQQS